MRVRPKVHQPMLEALADVALIDATTCAAAGSMGVSWWHDKVKTGEAPQPVIREVRCTRWRLSDVRAFWLERADGKHLNHAVVVEKAKKASAAAKLTRQAAK